VDRGAPVVVLDPRFKIVCEPYVGLVGERDAADEVDVMERFAHDDARLRPAHHRPAVAFLASSELLWRAAFAKTAPGEASRSLGEGWRAHRESNPARQDEKPGWPGSNFL
jgi:hypothetical protein